jgi:hypothetical protein
MWRKQESYNTVRRPRKEGLAEKVSDEARTERKAVKKAGNL